MNVTNVAFVFWTESVSESERSVAALTAIERREWARIQKQNFTSGINKDNMDLIFKAVCMVRFIFYCVFNVFFASAFNNSIQQSTFRGKHCQDCCLNFDFRIQTLKYITSKLPSSWYLKTTSSLTRNTYRKSTLWYKSVIGLVVIRFSRMGQGDIYYGLFRLFFLTSHQRAL